MNQNVIVQCIQSAYIANGRREFETAAWWSRQALQLVSHLPEGWYNLGIALAGQGLRSDALTAFRKVIETTLTSSEAQNSVGLHLLELGEDDLAEECLKRAIELAPQDVFPQVNLGKLRHRQQRMDEALHAFDQAAQLQPELAPVYANRGAVLCELKRYRDAEHDCRKAVELSPNFPEAWSNLGVALQGQNRFRQAEDAFRKAIELSPENPDAWSNLGKALTHLKRHQDAELACRHAVRLAPMSYEAWSNLASALWGLKKFEAAAECFEKSQTQNPGAPYLTGYALYMRMMSCNWDGYVEQKKSVLDGVFRGERSIVTFPLLALTDDLVLQRKAAEIYATHEHPLSSELGELPSPVISGSKIRLAYISADFRDHPVANLLVETIERHDRSRFEVIALSFGPEDAQDAVRKRISKAFDRFFDVREKTDAEIATMAREIGVDIAVDLGGYTEDARTGVFSLRAAPVQVSYLGYLGTMGAPYMDYLIADPVLVPDDKRHFYAEKVACIPCYQANDSRRAIADKKFTREELGLPAKGFVFASFNNTYKIRPAVFDIWMRVIQQVPDSVLFLYADNPEVQQNLRKEASLRGIDPERLVFGGRIERSLYLARYRVADLFLDTFPYNAGTTASDALWSGLPVLTLMGESMASRMAASLLHGLDLCELITTTPADYEALAVALALQPARLQVIKEKLAQNRLTQPLFDAGTFNRNLEKAFEAMHQRHQEGLPPGDICINP